MSVYLPLQRVFEGRLAGGDFIQRVLTTESTERTENLHRESEELVDRVPMAV